MSQRHFVILIGGPGLFIDCDPKHDKTWKNYVVPVQVAAMNKLYKLEDGEIVHWVVFEPPYRNRWTDDSNISTWEWFEQLFFDRELHEVRKKAADNVIAKGSTSYLASMQLFAKANGIQYHGIERPDDFWAELEKLPDGSITRVWYSGHAAPAGLMLSLAHDSACAAISTHLIRVESIGGHAHLEKKFVAGSTVASEFYGCGTRDFAKKWYETFKVPAAGSTSAVTFAEIGRSGGDLLERIRTTPTPQGSPGWTTFP
jgi:hypothetical protein